MYKSDAIPNFTELDWKTKQDFLWSKVIEDESLGEYHTLDALKTSMKTPFENEWDILTAGRRKVKKNHKSSLDSFILKPTYGFYISNPLDSRKSKLLKTKTKNC